MLLSRCPGSLANIAKHSGADRAVLKLANDGNMLQMEISDNGRGFTQAETSQRALGLASMRERLRRLWMAICRSNPRRDAAPCCRHKCRGNQFAQVLPSPAEKQSPEHFQCSRFRYQLCPRSKAGPGTTRHSGQLQYLRSGSAGLFYFHSRIELPA